MSQMANHMETPNGTAPVTTAEDSEVRIAKLQADLAQAILERDDANTLAANRKSETERKVGKFEEFQTTVVADIASLKETVLPKLTALEKENQDLKEILKTQGATTPSISTAPSVPAPTEQESAEEARVKRMFGLPVIKS